MALASTSLIVWVTVRIPLMRNVDLLILYRNHLPGIGLETHESPYLRGGSDDVLLTGHTFSDEPGIYIEGEVRHFNWSVVLYTNRAQDRRSAGGLLLCG